MRCENTFHTSWFWIRRVCLIQVSFFCIRLLCIHRMRNTFVHVPGRLMLLCPFRVPGSALFVALCPVVPLVLIRPAQATGSCLVLNFCSICLCHIHNLLCGVSRSGNSHVCELWVALVNLKLESLWSNFQSYCILCPCCCYPHSQCSLHGWFDSFNSCRSQLFVTLAIVELWGYLFWASGSLVFRTQPMK